MTRQQLMYSEVVHALHEEIVHPTCIELSELSIKQCVDWIQVIYSVLPPLCALDLSSSAIH